MADGYEYSGESDFSDLDEWLCEYVDGTIDPVVCEALEEYMQANPALAHHVERLRQTRNLLCFYGCRHQAPKSLQPSLQRRLASEIVEENRPLFASVNLPFVSIAAISSLVAFFLIVASPAETSFPQESISMSFSPPKYRVERNVLRATPLTSLAGSKYYLHFATSGLPTEYDRHLAPAELITPYSDTSSAPAAPSYAAIAP